MLICADGTHFNGHQSLWYSFVHQESQLFSWMLICADLKIVGIPGAQNCIKDFGVHFFRIRSEQNLGELEQFGDPNISVSSPL